jgi:hypothetical protein
VIRRHRSLIVHRLAVLLAPEASALMGKFLSITNK